MAELWVTIPTAGRDTLEAAVESCGVPRERIVIVKTAALVPVPFGCVVIEDYGPVNIHRWWNVGIDYAQAHGATHVAVLNDDALMGPASLWQLLEHIGTAAIATPGGDFGLFTDPTTPPWRILNGSCWLLDLASGLRPDEGYRWWFGDDDLDRRARRDHGGIQTVPVEWEHLHATESTTDRPDLQDLAADDAARWHASLNEGARIGVGITTHNRLAMIGRGLYEWRKHLPAGATLVVVDDASSTPVPDADFRFDQNVGVARAKNKAIELLMAAGVEHLFLADDDTWPISRDWWRPYVESPEPHLMHVFEYRTGPQPIASDGWHVAWPHPCGCFLYAHRSVVERVGGMDPGFGRWGHEHVDWSNRIHNAGLTTWRFADVEDSDQLVYCADSEGTERSVPKREREHLVKVNTARYLDRIESSDYVEYREQRDVVLACWLHGPDHQRRNRTTRLSCEDATRALRASVTGADLVVVGDDDTADEQAPPLGLSVYQSRWVHMHHWLRRHPEARWVWLVDAGDVTMLSEPWAEMQPDRLYVGWEPTLLGCQWMRDNHPSSRIQAFIDEHADEQLLNCGLIGGDRATVLEFLRDLIRLYEDHAHDRWRGVDPGALGNDMGPTNYVMRQPKWDGRIVATSQVCTLFKHHETAHPFAWWAHK